MGFEQIVVSIKLQFKTSTILATIQLSDLQNLRKRINIQFTKVSIDKNLMFLLFDNLAQTDSHTHKEEFQKVIFLQLQKQPLSQALIVFIYFNPTK